MGIIGRKPITTPLWVQTAIAVTLATMLTVLAILLTSRIWEPVGGKGVLFAAFLAAPLILAAKSGWAYGTSIGVAFVTYLSACFLLVRFFAREKPLENLE